ncbi:unnamed protein product [Kuraishia capsulata CBS 1993]|uniref:V-type proton ATPase subunit E n=1 Tax=Kuraishia capsulata CBS 1993 TaxID=1382522 RepID=W6MRM4_9ASCO|nr:uncharacterized protein KUCA_T00005404001 [Kuraishia capsulata CBS 1993]CDK29416.1 unnamed protein product [Kuraishia capsulata CBS 1993]
MEAFIKKEAEEKSKEIKLKADEEYEIEKASIVRAEINSIDVLYESKFKKASLAQQITKSTIANKTRLKVLATREQVLDDIFENAEEELKKISKNEKSYKPVLVGLIEEAVLSLLEKSVTVRVRKADLELAKSAAEEALKNFEEKAKFSATITFDETNFLDPEIAGGVVVINGTGKIEVNNTLEERLKLLSEGALPAVRLELFGPSTTRKFFD